MASANLAWEEMMKFVKIDPDLTAFTRSVEYKTLMTFTITNCTIEALFKDRSMDEGFRVLLTTPLTKSTSTGTTRFTRLYNEPEVMPETLNSMTTTRDWDLNSFCHEMDTYCMNILNGTVSAEDFYGYLYAR